MATFPSQQFAPGQRADHQVETEFGELYDVHCERVFRFCLRRLGDREDAADAVQDTYAKAWLALRDGCHVRDPLAWLLTIAANVCASRYRASRARPTQAPLTDDAAAVTPLTSSELSGLPEALRALPDEQRHAFVLRELRGCSYDEIGDAIGASHASVAGLLHRARRSLAASLSGASKKVLVALPFPSVLRSAFEGSGAIVAATAAVTAAGTLALIGPPLPHFGLGGHHETPATAGTSAQRAAASTPLTVSWSFRPPAMSVARRATHRPTPSPIAPSTRSMTPSVAAAASADSGSATEPRSAPGDGLQTPPAIGPEEQAGAPAIVPSGSSEQGVGTAQTAPTVPAGSPAAPRANGKGHGKGVAGAKSQGNGPPADPGAQGTGPGDAVAGAKSQGNGPPADPGAQGNGQVNDAGNANANGLDGVTGSGQAPGQVPGAQSEPGGHGDGNAGGGNLPGG